MDRASLRDDLFIALLLPTALFVPFGLFAPLTIFAPYNRGEIATEIQNLLWIEVQAVKLAIPILIFRRLPLLSAYFACLAVMVAAIRIFPPPGNPGAAFFMLPIMPLIPFGFERLSDVCVKFLGSGDPKQGAARLELPIRITWLSLMACQLILLLKLDFGG